MMFTKSTFKSSLTKYGLMSESIWKSSRIIRELSDVFGAEGDTDDKQLFNIIKSVFDANELGNLVDLVSEDDFIRIATKIAKENNMVYKKVWELFNVITGAVKEITYDYDDLIEQDAMQQKRKLNDYKIVDGVITGYTGEDEYIAIPDVYKGKKIRRIEARAFMSKGLRSVSIPEGIIEIGENAFANNQIEELVLPKSIRVIDSHAFSENRITRIRIPDKIEIIHEFSFARNRLEDVKLPAGLQKIATGGFYMNKIKELVLPSSVKNIGVSAFEKNHINDIVFGLEIESIGNYAFRDNKLRYVCLPNSLKHIGLYAFNDNPIKLIHSSGFAKDLLTKNEAYDLDDSLELLTKYADHVCHKNIINEKMCSACNMKM